MEIFCICLNLQVKLELDTVPRSSGNKTSHLACEEPAEDHPANLSQADAKDLLCKLR